MIMRFGSGSSVREATHEASLILDVEKKGWKMLETPDSHGSMTTVKLEVRSGVGGKGNIG